MVRTALESLVRRAGLACMSTGSWQQAHDWSLQHGFDGVLVGPPRRTAARYGLPDVDAVLNWLERVR